jgi:hypothetical protein
MRRLKTLTMIVMLALAMSLCAPQAMAGDMLTPPIAGEIGTPGLYGVIHNPGEILTPGLYALFIALLG